MFPEVDPVLSVGKSLSKIILQFFAGFLNPQKCTNWHLLKDFLRVSNIFQLMNIKVKVSLVYHSEQMLTYEQP